MVKTWMVPALALVLLLIGCAGGPGGHDTFTASPTLEQAAIPDSLAFVRTLAEYASRPDSVRSVNRARAEKIAASWREFEGQAKNLAKSEVDQRSFEDSPPSTSMLGFGLGNSLLDLKRATDLDPAFAEGWAAMGKLSAVAGDLHSAGKYLARARTAALQAPDPPDDTILLQIYREQAWVLRDLACWPAGLDLVEQGLERWPGDPDLMLVKGLLLAGAGRCTEAMDLAVRMQPMEYPRYDFIYRGLMAQKSAYANNWIRAMALLQIGETEMAYHKLGDLDLYAYRARIPHSARYWRDAALLAELMDDPKAPLYYAVGFVTRPYRNFYPVMAANITSQVQDVPDPRLPVFTSFGPRFYIGGSPFSYVGLQINMMAQAPAGPCRTEASGRALQMLDYLEKLAIRPAVCRALRGRVYYANDDFQPARIELSAADEAFRSSGRPDATTSLLLGMIDLQSGDYLQAQDNFLHALEADSTSAICWRSLAIAYARQGRKGRAEKAMDRAVALAPWNVAGLYNRGLFRLQDGRLGPAAADLQRALAVAPDNREVQHLRDLVLDAAKQAGVDSATVVEFARGVPLGVAANPDSITADLQREIDAMFVVPDSLRMDDREADRRIEVLLDRYLRHEEPVTRGVLALALIDRRRFPEAQALLAPHWGRDLSPAEQIMLLYTDHQLGEIARADHLVRDVIGSRFTGENPGRLLKETRDFRTSTNPPAFDPQTDNVHGFFGWWLDARHNSLVIENRPKIVYDMALYRMYGKDPLFEDAVWGLSQTPESGVGYGPGTGLGQGSQSTSTIKQ